MNKILNLKKCLLLIGTVLFMGFLPLLAEETDQVKSYLKEGLELYNQRQYVRALDLFKQALALDPKNEIADEYVKSTKQRILEWESQTGDDDKKKPAPTWDNLLNAKNGLSDRDTAPNAKDIIAARKSLVDRMKNRSTNIDNIVQVKNENKSMDIMLFHDQLFLPGLTTLRDEALPVLANVADMVKKNLEKQVTVRSVAHAGNDEESFGVYPESPEGFSEPTNANAADATALFQDLESTRAFILFTYLAQKSMEKSPNAALQ